MSSSQGRGSTTVGAMPSPFAFAIPALCDVIGSGVSVVGLLMVPAVVYQMIRNSYVVFAPVLTTIVLREQLRQYQWLGVVVVFVGLFCVACAAILDTGGRNKASMDLAFGMILVLLGQFIASFHSIFEEHFLEGLTVSAKKTLGMEGFWGVLFAGVLLVAFSHVPGDDNGVVEDLSETLSMWRHSRSLQILSASYIISVGVCDLCCLKITRHVSVMTRCLIDCCRSMLLWTVSTTLYYAGYSTWGAPWTTYSWVQLIGLVLLSVGTLLYNDAIRFPGLEYEQLGEEQVPPTAWSPKVLPSRRGIHIKPNLLLDGSDDASKFDSVSGDSLTSPFLTPITAGIRW